MEEATKRLILGSGGGAVASISSFYWSQAF
jgi:hypothetical protein